MNTLAMPLTLCVQIGNSDDKLTQQQWSDFVRGVTVEVQLHASRIHFQGFSESRAAWQNACWVFDVEMLHEDRLERLEHQLGRLAREYKQDSIALSKCLTRFIGPHP